jgi:hypothetical protein
MGLDTYASNTSEEIRLTPAEEQAFEEADISLCGGIFSGTAGSFRGKMYGILIIEITGQSLYQDWIPPETVKEMYDALMDCDPEEAKELVLGKYKTERDIIELRKFLKICVDHKLGLINWW